MEKVFIVGASGYIGKHLLEQLGKLSNLELVSCGRGKEDEKLDLNDKDFSNFLELISDGDYLVLLASISSPDMCRDNPELAWAVNVENTNRLIHELTSQGVRVIFASSDVVVGNNEGLSEDDAALSPAGIYGEMKAAVENNVINNELVKVARFSYVLGKGDKFSTMLIDAAKDNVTVDIFDGFERNVVSIDDVTEGIYKLIDNWDNCSESVFNFSGPECISRESMTSGLSNVIDGLSYRVSEAPVGFWNNRPRRIETGCENFTKLLGRSPKSLSQIIDEWSE